jgi:hypothetical protein
MMTFLLGMLLGVAALGAIVTVAYALWSLADFLIENLDL